MGGENRHCTHLTVHYPSPVTLEEGYNKARVPQSLGFGLIHPVSTRPRPSLDASHSSTGKEGRHGTTLRVTSSSHPLRHHGVQGWPLIPGGTSLQSTQQGSIKHHLKTHWRPGLLLPYKRTGQDPTEEQGTTGKKHKIEINISSNHLCTPFSL
jgi:hypothetical protein